MLKSEIKLRTDYAFRDKRIPGAPLEHIRILEHIRHNKWKAEWIDPNPGLVHYAESGQLVCTWKGRKAFLEEEENRERILKRNEEQGYEEDSPITDALYEVFESIGESGVSFYKGVLRCSPEAIDRIRTQAQMKTEQSSPFAYTDRRGTLHLPFDEALELAQKFCATEPAAVLDACDPRHLGAEIGFFSVLHTWDQRLQFHPHVHCVLAAGGLAPDHSRWISSRRSFFLPIKVLSRVFRGKFVAGLRSAFLTGTLQFHGRLLPLAEPRAFAAWLRVLFRHDWVVYSKRPFGGPEHALRYLGAYTHRVAISNSRLVALAEDNVTFRWRDSAHGNKKRFMTLPVEEFLRRFLLHLLPPGFVRIRNFGFLANRQRATLLPLCFQLLSRSENIPASVPSPSTDQPRSLWTCPVCGGAMHVVERLSAAQLLLRSPPLHDEYAA